MTQEEKAKRYDEVLEELRGLLEGIHEEKCKILEEDITSIFPELQENEDERIRKVLVDYFKRYKEQEECGIKTFYGIPTDNIITWLEKQGEQKPTWSEEDEEILRTIISDGIRGAEFDMLQIDWLKSIKDRSTWKPSDEQMKVLEAMLTVSPQSPTMTSTLMELYEDLKKLRVE